MRESGNCERAFAGWAFTSTKAPRRMRILRETQARNTWSKLYQWSNICRKNMLKLNGKLLSSSPLVSMINLARGTKTSWKFLNLKNWREFFMRAATWWIGRSDKHKTFCHAFMRSDSRCPHTATRVAHTKNAEEQQTEIYFRLLGERQTSFSYGNIYINLGLCFFRRTGSQGKIVFPNWKWVFMMPLRAAKFRREQAEPRTLLLFIWCESRCANIYLNNNGGDKICCETHHK